MTTSPTRARLPPSRWRDTRRWAIGAAIAEPLTAFATLASNPAAKALHLTLIGTVEIKVRPRVQRLGLISAQER